MLSGGELIALATKAKRKHEETIQSLIDKIKRLEATHKCSSAQTTLQDLSHTHALLLEEQGKHSRQSYVLNQKVLYEHGNKSGRLLARTVQASKVSSTKSPHTRPSGLNIFQK